MISRAVRVGFEKLHDMILPSMAAKAALYSVPERGRVQPTCVITVDVEALPQRATSDHLSRLVWGDFGGTKFGISRMMDIAEKHNVQLTFFLDYAEVALYGDEIIEIGRKIQSRGHDLQLHIHQRLLPNEFYERRGLSRLQDLKSADRPTADAFFDFLCEQHLKVAGTAPVAFRGAGYHYNDHLLSAMVARGILLSSNYNPSRADQPIQIGGLPPFRWGNGAFELPISTVFGFRGLARHSDYNFNGAPFAAGSDDDFLARHADFSASFQRERGEYTPLVLVLHSWSFLTIDQQGHFSSPQTEAPGRFDQLLAQIKERRAIISAAKYLALAQDGILLPAGPLPYSETKPIAVDTTAATPVEDRSPACPICATKSSLFKDYNGSRRLCSGCGSVERQRVFANLYDRQVKHEFDLASRRLMMIAPSSSETRFLRSQGVQQISTVDVRPQVKPDIVANVCSMPDVPDESFDAAIASYVLTCVYDLKAALAEFYRTLKPGGRLFTCDPLALGAVTVEYKDVDQISSWYGREAYDTYRIGSFRKLGSVDLEAEFRAAGFNVTRLYGIDDATAANVIWYMCEKP